MKLLWTTYKDYTDAALLILESGLDYHDPEIIEEIIDRAIEILKENI